MDTSIVNAPLPDIGREPGFSSTGLSWVVTAYALAFGGLILPSGRVGSMIGPRRAVVGLQQLGGAMGLAVLTSVLATTGGLGAPLLATAAFPPAGLILFGVWARRTPAPDTTHA
ncbi:hypothetical protein [Streptomyces sp. KHY 26]|uniref:hypothetical protein n=1 Tax=Streptomyces sp. KHY 26 TaxID=3097359 RepID=UPI00376F0854